MNTPSMTSIWSVLPLIFPAQGAGSVINVRVHDHDLSVELFFDPQTPADWLPGNDQFRAVGDLGFETVYGVFSDETEIIGAWRRGHANGRRDPAGDRWIMGSCRDRVGTPRYAPGMAEGSIVLRGDDAVLFREFLAWRSRQRPD